MSTPTQSKILQIDKNLRRQRDNLRKEERRLEKEIDSQALRLHFRDASQAKSQLQKTKRELSAIEKKCLECAIWLREAGSSDPKKQENALKRAQKL